MGKNRIFVTDVTGIILAGGKSSRFGSNKALYEYQGKKLVEYSIETLKPLCGRILLSTNSPEIFDFTGLQTVADVYPDCGPVGGIHACLQQSKTEHNLIIGCDLPFLKTALYAYLLEKSKNQRVIIPTHNGFKEPLVSYYARECLSVLEDALESSNNKILQAVSPLNPFFLDVAHQSFYNETLFYNINFREDIKPGS